MPISGNVVFSTIQGTAQELLTNNYVRALVILVGFFIVAKIFYAFLKSYLKKLAEKTETTFDDKLLKRSEIPVALLLFLLGIKLAIIPLNLGRSVESILQHLVSSINLVLVSYIIVVIFDLTVEHWGESIAQKTESKMDDQLISLGHKGIRFIVIIIAAMFLLQIWGIQIGPLLASLGIVGIAVAFGLQNTLGNIFGGISLIMDRSIRVGDVIKLDKDAMGTVLDVGIRATRIKTWNNEVIIIPNGEMANNRIKNYVLPTPVARIEVPVSVAYGSNINKVKKVIMDIVKKLPNLDKKNEPRVLFMEMADSSLNFICHVWLTSYKDRLSTKEDLNCKIYNALNKEKVEIPFPQMDVHVNNQKN